jgi:pimeloyl-ACP methyl ester carboxylesterase
VNGARLAPLLWLACVSIVTLSSSVAGAAEAGPSDANLPAAIYTDPPSGAAHPASGKGVQFKSDGAVVNAQVYQPAGAGMHPAVVLLHSLPGNEQNLDLAQSMRRAGWTVITFHYRGSWGSGGAYSLTNGIDDTKALLDLLGRPDNASAWGVDPSRIVLIGHSYGGYVAARVASDAPRVLGVALIAPWDISCNQRAWASLAPARRQSVGVAAFFDVDGRLSGATARSLFDEVMAKGAGLDLTKLAARLMSRSLLIVTATRDNDCDKAGGLLAALHDRHAEHLNAEVMDTDHGFSDHRIALQSAILRWLAPLADTRESAIRHGIPLTVR